MHQHKNSDVLNNNDIYFQKILRQSERQSEKVQSSKKGVHDFQSLDKQIKSLYHQLEKNEDSVQSIIHFLLSEALQDHIIFQFFKPSAKTYIGEKILRENEVWILVLVSFKCLYCDRNKYNEFLEIQIKEQLERYVIDFNEQKEIYRKYEQIIISQQQYQEGKENIEQLDLNRINLNEVQIDKQTQLSGNSLENLDQNYQIDQIIKDQLEDLNNQIEQQSYPKKGRLSFTQRLLKSVGWKSKQKNHSKSIKNITIICDLESIQLINQTALIEKVIQDNINDNELHQIVKLSQNNSNDILQYGDIALIQIKNTEMGWFCYLQDINYYKNQLLYRYQQIKQIYIPYGKYTFIETQD